MRMAGNHVGRNVFFHINLLSTARSYKPLERDYHVVLYLELHDTCEAFAEMNEKPAQVQMTKNPQNRNTCLITYES